MAKKGQKEQRRAVAAEHVVTDVRPGEGVALSGVEYPPDATPLPESVRTVTLLAAVRCKRGELKAGVTVPASHFTDAELASLRAQHAVSE